MKTCRRGLHSYDEACAQCPECLRERRREWRKVHPEYSREWSVAKREQDPSYYRSREQARYSTNKDYFKKHTQEWHKSHPGYYAEKGRAWREAHPEEYRQRRLTWRSANREAIREANRKRSAAWRKANPERAHESSVIRGQRRRARLLSALGEPVTRAHLRLLLKAQDGRCRYCSVPLGKGMHLDHRMPLARGGKHVAANLCWACPACNRIKHTMSEQEFLASPRRRIAA